MGRRNHSQPKPADALPEELVSDEQTPAEPAGEEGASAEAAVVDKTTAPTPDQQDSNGVAAEPTPAAPAEPTPDETPPAAATEPPPEPAQPELDEAKADPTPGNDLDEIVGDDDLPPEPPAQPKSADAPAPRFRVWAHGGLIYNGELYPPGYELAITEAEANAMASCAVERF